VHSDEGDMMDFMRNWDVSLIDAIDVAVVAIVIYFVLRLMRGTRAAQMLIGLAVLLLVYELARIFGLLTVEWIFSQFFTAFIIIFVVLFQHEIRRGLMQVAVNPLAYSGPPVVMMIDDLVESSVALVHRGWGGLIVIERETGLKHFIESGVEMNVAVRADVVQTLFCPQAPMHDGALVVRYGHDGAYIVAARVLLPLAQASSLPGGFGTRHRAAVGLTEESDALVIVVSEEGADMRIASGGVLSEALGVEQLKSELATRLQGYAFSWSDK